MPGIVTSVTVSSGQSVNAGDLLLTIEAMKMETGIYAEKSNVIKIIHVAEGSQLDAKDLLLEYEPDVKST